LRKALMILIAGPYRSGTNDDTELIGKNVELMESYAVPIFRIRQKNSWVSSGSGSLPSE
jgi:hypothetical protein